MLIVPVVVGDLFNATHSRQNQWRIFHSHERHTITKSQIALKYQNLLDPVSCIQRCGATKRPVLQQGGFLESLDPHRSPPPTRLLLLLYLLRCVFCVVIQLRHKFSSLGSGGCQDIKEVLASAHLRSNLLMSRTVMMQPDAFERASLCLDLFLSSG